MAQFKDKRINIEYKFKNYKFREQVRTFILSEYGVQPKD